MAYAIPLIHLDRARFHVAPCRNVEIEVGYKDNKGCLSIEAMRYPSTPIVTAVADARARFPQGYIYYVGEYEA